MSSPWWSIPQAIIWIVTRSESQVLRADGVRTMAGLGRMIGMRWASRLDEPPVSLSAAPDELLQAWQARRIALFGRKWGKELSRLILGLSGLRFRDYRGEVYLADRTLYIDRRPFWSNLSVRAGDCKRAGLSLPRERSRPLGLWHPHAAPRTTKCACSLKRGGRRSEQNERERAATCC